MLNAEPQRVRIHILGAGRAGATLARAWHIATLADIGVLVNRSLESAESAADSIGAGVAAAQWLPAFGEQISAFPEQAHWIMLAVPDGVLAEVAHALANRLADNLVRNPDTQPVLAFHISGQLDNQVLEPLARQGIATASAHPVLAFAQPKTALQQLPGSHCLISAEHDHFPALEALFSGIGMHCVAAPPGLDKSMYHAATVCASNFTCALQYLAGELAQQAGLPEDSARPLLASLSQRSLESVAEHGPLPALTGPIERGDAAAVERMLKAIGQLPEQQADGLRALAAVTMAMAREKGGIDAAQLSALRNLLDA